MPQPSTTTPPPSDQARPKPRGRHFFANPGPTNIPDSVLRAMDRPSIDFNDPEFVPIYDAAFAGVKRILRTSQHLFMYNASGHGAWEASLTNLLSPGDTILVLESGYFSEEWASDGARPRAGGPVGGGRLAPRRRYRRRPQSAGRRYRARDQGGLRRAQ